VRPALGEAAGGGGSEGSKTRLSKVFVTSQNRP